ncbi:hypothetical protein BK125_18700 [Paenibacillus odorifer]|uniref:Uncharacterized protein n=1 Tax=Paenibacillus odorifer TaxID=189426 RepID=A0ABX3GJ46_9BACL|nr:hypothetical protein [Paenibacillus odorifer]OMC76513.1 hypothetical protein BK125_18700 [Paenibacillus odorifer]OMD24882.1 hypothetical protein BSO21_21470 [Paenibacillus odorifer]
MGDIIKRGSEFIVPEYRIIYVTVPDVRTDEPMPERMIFYVDTRFTTAQVKRLREMIVTVLFYWGEHVEQINDGEVSRYESCVNKYARFNLAPVWFADRIANGRAAAAVQMAGFTTQIQANGYGRAAKAYIKYKEPTAGESFTIRGLNASSPEKSSLTVTVNPINLSSTAVGTTMLSGSLFHAWLHREGYRHPAGRFTSYFAGEASMCIMRDNKDKVPGVPASTYTKWLD